MGNKALEKHITGGDNIYKEKCCSDQYNGLQYKGLSVVYLHIFTLPEICDTCNKCELTLRLESCHPHVCQSHGTCSKKHIREKSCEPHVQRKDDEQAVYSQILSYKNEKDSFRQYVFPAFSFALNVLAPCHYDEDCKTGKPCKNKVANSEEEPCKIEITGTMQVEMSLFFNKTVSMSYRMVIDNPDADEDKKIGFVKVKDPLTTDQLINLIALHLDAEEWDVKEENENGEDDSSKSKLNSKVDFTVTGLDLDSNGVYKKDDIKNIETLKLSELSILDQVLDRYKKYVLNICREAVCVEDNKSKEIKVKDDSGESIKHTDSKYVLVDIWESIQHYDKLFEDLKNERKEASIISHIVKYHKSELIGLMSMYPKEWPYRDTKAFDTVCGGNIAIDTDDLVLANQNICVVFGTYALRSGKGVSIDWAKVMEDRKTDHVSWSEYLLMLEMIMAKKHAIKYANEALLKSVLSENAFEKPTKAIEDNAKLHLDISKMLTQLDAANYSKFVSHKIMYDRTIDRLGIDRDRLELEEMMERIDTSLGNIRDAQSLKQNRGLKLFIGVISIASLIQVLFMFADNAVLDDLGVMGSQADTARFWIEMVSIIFLMLAAAVGILLLIEKAVTIIKADTKSRRRKKENNDE